MKRGYLQILLAAALFLLALGLTLYPVVSNWYIGRHQSRIQTEYREVLEQTDSAEIESIRESAAAYNKTITPGAAEEAYSCLLYTSPSPRDRSLSRMPSSA